MSCFHCHLFLGICWFLFWFLLWFIGYSERYCCVFIFYSIFLCMHVCIVASVMPDSETLWTVACQIPLSIEIFRQKYWSGLLCPPPGDLLNPWVEPASPVVPELHTDSLPQRHLEALPPHHGWYLILQHCDQKRCLKWFQFLKTYQDLIVAQDVIYPGEFSMCTWKKVKSIVFGWNAL